MITSRSRRVLVTGVASGIGLEGALQLAQRGDHVIVADRNVNGGKAIVQKRLWSESEKQTGTSALIQQTL